MPPQQLAWRVETHHRCCCCLLLIGVQNRHQHCCRPCSLLLQCEPHLLLQPLALERLPQLLGAHQQA
jgi:hypothetical protein